MTVVVRHATASPAAAGRLQRAVRADNPEFVTVDVEGRELVIRLESASAASARATLEDLLSCLTAAERAEDAGGRPP